MSDKIEKLRGWGCDVDGALDRTLNDEEFYLSCLSEIPCDPNFGLLEKALRENDLHAAFDAAHALKGIFANLGLTPLLQQVAKIVEPLRAGKNDHLEAELAALKEMNNHLSEILQ